MEVKQLSMGLFNEPPTTYKSTELPLRYPKNVERGYEQFEKYHALLNYCPFTVTRQSYSNNYLMCHHVLWLVTVTQQGACCSEDVSVKGHACTIFTLTSPVESYSVAHPPSHRRMLCRPRPPRPPRPARRDRRSRRLH